MTTAVSSFSLASQAWSERTAVAAAYAAWIPRVLASQVLDGGLDDGAFDEHGHGWRDGRWTGFVLAKLLAARSWSRQIGVQPDAFDEPLRRGVGFLLRRQLPSGELDLAGAYSANEAGFVVPGLAAGYRTLIADGLLPDVAEQLEHFLGRAGEAILAGEAYTANHRWTAACAPLASLHRLWPDTRYLAKIEAYLADGIDCCKEGMWHIERCPGYSDVANHGLILLADTLGRPELLEPVVRSCRLMSMMMQPNGEWDTSFSHRQSRGARRAQGPSYFVARRAAIHSQDGTIAALADLARCRIGSEFLYPLPFALDQMAGSVPEARALPTQYTVHLKKHQIIRRRAGDVSLTLAADEGNHFFDSVRDQWGGAKCSDDWFHLHHGPVIIQSIQVAVAGLHNIQPDTLRVLDGDEYVLKGDRDGWEHTLHFRPDSPKVHVPWNLRHQIHVKWITDRIEISFDVQSERSLMASLRIFVAAGCQLGTASSEAECVLSPGQHVALSGNRPIILSLGQHAIQISGLPASAHRRKIDNPEPIPSQKFANCAILELGLRMPLDFAIQVACGPTSHWHETSESSTRKRR